MKVAPVLTAQRSVGPLWLAKADDSGDGKSGHARLLKAHRQFANACRPSGCGRITHRCPVYRADLAESRDLSLNEGCGFRSGHTHLFLK
jgi:hypothetical protein